MYEDLTNDKVSLVKQNGDEFNDIRALVRSDTILIEDISLPIEEDDLILRKLPNGLIEKYVVIDRGFFAGINESDEMAHYRIKVKREGIIRNNDSSTNITNNFHGANSRVNINSQDNSINVSKETNETVFTEIRQAIQNNVQNETDKEILLEKLEELKQAKGTKGFIEKYKDFMELAEKHITIIAPFLPALSQLLS